MKFKKGLSALTLLLALTVVSCGTKTSKASSLTSSQTPISSKATTSQPVSSSQVSASSKASSQSSSSSKASSQVSSKSESSAPVVHVHNWGAPTYTWSDDYTTCTAERVCADNPAHKETETVNSAYSLVNSSTCCEEGVGRYTATFTNTAFAAQTHDIKIDIDPTAHNYSETVVAPTADEEGYTLHECSHCHDSFKTDITSAENKFTYEEYDSGYKITGYEGEAEIINVPETHNGLQVKCIGSIASGRVIHVPDSITEFDRGCFRDNTTLEEANIPYGTTSIDSMFYGCTSLKSIVVPDTVTYIGDYTFRNCNSIEEMTLPFIGTGNVGRYRYMCCIFGASNYSNNETYVPPTLKKVTIGSACTELYSYAFYNCKYIEEIVLGENITRIGNGAFGNTTSVQEINIPKNVSLIDESAFSTVISPTGLTAINVDPENENYTSEDGILYNKDKTSLLRYPCSKSGDSFTVPNTVKEIGYGAFRYSKYLKNITINDNVETLGMLCFANIAVMEEIVLPNSIKSIPACCFQGCAKLLSITLPNQLEEIWEYAFSSLPNQTSITIPATVTMIKSCVFAYTKVTYLYFEGNIRDIQFDKNWNVNMNNTPVISVCNFSNPYGLKVNDDYYVGASYVGFGDNNNQKYIQFRTSAELAVGDKFSFYDNLKGEKFAVAIDPYSLGGSSSTSENWKAYFDFDGMEYTVKQNATYYFYLKINGTEAANAYFYL